MTAAEMKAFRPSEISDAALREAFSRLAASVVVVTAKTTIGERRAITVSSFTSVSLDPPLVLFCLDRDAFHHDVFAKADAFAINLLGADQDELSNRFAAHGEDDFEDLETFELATGSPCLERAIFSLDCIMETRHQAGDHVIIIGRATALATSGADDSRPPLLYCRRGYCEPKTLSD